MNDRLCAIAETLRTADLTLKRQTAGWAVDSGKLLSEAKLLSPRGTFKKWCVDQTPYSYRRCAFLMQFAKGAESGTFDPAESVDKVWRALSGGDVTLSSESVEWYTPTDIVDRVVRVLGSIDIDPCSNGDASTVPAARRLTKNDDGLAADWAGKTFCNPPYGRTIDKWIEKLVAEHERGSVTEAIALVPSRTDTAWFSRLREYPRCFVRGRLRFANSEHPAPFPSTVFYLGPNVARFAEIFSEIGDLYMLVDTAALLRKGAA